MTQLRQVIGMELAPMRVVGQRLSKARLCYRVGRRVEALTPVRLGKGTDSLRKRSAPPMRLQLLLVRPKPRPGIVRRGLRQKFVVAVDIIGNEVSREVARLKLNRRFLRLVDGTKAVQLPAGKFQRRVSWTVEAMEEVEETCVQVSVGRQAIQLAQFQLRVLPVVRIK